MKWNIRVSRKRTREFVTVTLPAFTLIAGCHMYPNVFFEDLPPASLVTTASAARAKAAPAEPALRTRDFKQVQVQPQDGMVEHGPLWMEDPFEMVGSEDGRFAATWEDAFYFVYGPSRYIVNLAFLPVSMIVQPVWESYCSDGVERRSRLSSWLPEPYDAEPCHGEMVPIDVHETWSFDLAAAETPAPLNDPAPDGAGK